jgi:hypothetical protein
MRPVDVCAALNAMAVAPDAQPTDSNNSRPHHAHPLSDTAGRSSICATSVDWQSLAEPRHVNGLRLVRLLQSTPLTLHGCACLRSPMCVLSEAHACLCLHGQVTLDELALCSAQWGDMLCKLTISVNV